MEVIGVHHHIQLLLWVLGNQVLLLCHLSSPYFIVLDMVINGIGSLFDMVLFKRENNFSHLLTAFWGVHIYHGIHMEARRQRAGVGFLLLSYESRGPNLGCLTLCQAFTLWAILVIRHRTYKVACQVRDRASCPFYSQSYLLSVCVTCREGGNICETSQFSLLQPVDRDQKQSSFLM